MPRREQAGPLVAGPHNNANNRTLTKTVLMQGETGRGPGSRAHNNANNRTLTETVLMRREQAGPLVANANNRTLTEKVGPGLW